MISSNDSFLFSRIFSRTCARLLHLGTLVTPSGPLVSRFVAREAEVECLDDLEVREVFVFCGPQPYAMLKIVQGCDKFGAVLSELGDPPLLLRGRIVEMYDFFLESFFGVRRRSWPVDFEQAPQEQLLRDVFPAFSGVWGFCIEDVHVVGIRGVDHASNFLLAIMRHELGKWTPILLGCQQCFFAVFL